MDKFHLVITGRRNTGKSSIVNTILQQRSEERRVGKECRSRWPEKYRKKFYRQHDFTTGQSRCLPHCRHDNRPGKEKL